MNTIISLWYSVGVLVRMSLLYTLHTHNKYLIFVSICMKCMVALKRRITVTTYAAFEKSNETLLQQLCFYYDRILFYSYCSLLLAVSQLFNVFFFLLSFSFFFAVSFILSFFFHWQYHHFLYTFRAIPVKQNVLH